jgi:hypothetical protein
MSTTVIDVRQRLASRPRPSQWISLGMARKLSGIASYGIHQRALRGEIKFRALPGRTIEFLCADVLRIAAEVNREA